MASGHCPDIRPGGHGAQVVDRLLADPAMRERMIGYRPVNRDYDVPYLSGYSADGHTIYMDRHLPAEITLKDGHSEKKIDPTPFLSAHEIFEWAAMETCGWGYAHAHEAATGFERRQVLKAGLSWQAYSEALKPFIKGAEKEAVQKPPPDLDLRAYREDPPRRPLLAKLEAAQGKNADKQSKDAVNYSEGHPGSHCGPVKGWPASKECEHFVAPSSCECVAGAIKPKFWCHLWEAKGHAEED